MPREVGRKLIVKRDIGGVPTTIATIRTKNPTFVKEPVDVTTDDDNGWRTLLPEPGQQQVDLSFSGITSDDTLISAMLAGTPVLEAVTLEFPSGLTIAGEFFFNNLSITGEYNNAITFEGEMQSSGEQILTPAP